jgi:hypothetical protein
MSIANQLHIEVQEAGRLLRNLRLLAKLCAEARDNDYSAVQAMPPRIRAIQQVRAVINANNIPVSRMREILGAGILSEISAIFDKLPAIRTYVRDMTQSVVNTYDDTDNRQQTIVFGGVEDQVLETAHPALYGLIIDVLSHFPDL